MLLGQLPEGWGPQKIGVFMNSSLGLSKKTKSKYAGKPYVLRSPDEDIETCLKAFDVRVDELRRKAGLAPHASPLQIDASPSASSEED